MYCDSRIKLLNQLVNPYLNKENLINFHFEELHNELHCAIEKGESFLIKLHPTSQSLCGLYYVCHECLNSSCTIDICYDIHHYRLDQKTIEHYSQLWEELCQSDAPLRVIKDGCVCDAFEDEYDPFILRIIGDKVMNVREVLQHTRSYRINSLWVGMRIRKMLEEEILEIVNDADTLPDANIRRKLA